MTVAEVAVLVEDFQGLDGIVVEILESLESVVNRLRQRGFFFHGLFIKFQNLGDVFT